jgi:predicted nucleotidyltransferase
VDSEALVKHCQDLLFENRKGGHLMYLVLAGSHAYGTNTEDSDLDLRGVFIPFQKYFFGLQDFEYLERDPHKNPGYKGPDVQLNSMKKFVSLAAKANPNVIEHMFVARENVLFVRDYMWGILENRHKFLSKLAAKTYGGYAQGQLHKMQSLGKDPQSRRYESFKKYGYDIKNASQCIRLLYQGRQILEDGDLTVELSGEALETVMAVKSGEWELDDLKVKALKLFNELNDAEKASSLPDKPDMKEIDKILIGVQCGLIGEHGVGAEE